MIARTTPPDWPRKWDDGNPHRGDGSVYLLAIGSARDDIIAVVSRACGALGVPLVVGEHRDIAGMQCASALIIYMDVNDGHSIAAAARAQFAGPPMIFLYEKDIPDVPYTDFRAALARDLADNAALGSIAFDDPLAIADAVCSALADLFRGIQVRNALVDLYKRLQQANIPRAQDWAWGVCAGVRKVLDDEVLPNIPVLPSITLSSDWMRSQYALAMGTHRTLVDGVDAKVVIAYADANEIVSHAGYSTLPIPVEKIVKAYGITIERVHLDDLSGRIRMEGPTAYIEVNKDERATRQNFTIAHEFGHFIMQHGQNCFRSNSRAWVLRADEEAADAFAAEMLMPETLIRAEFDEQQTLGRSINATVHIMAAKCGVGEQAMRRRLLFLSLIS